jgi:hypothetical protein
MAITLQQLEAHLWGAANILRGKTAGQVYKNYNPVACKLLGQLPMPRHHSGGVGPPDVRQAALTVPPPRLSVRG